VNAIEAQKKKELRYDDFICYFMSSRDPSQDAHETRKMHLLISLKSVKCPKVQ
jgi:hypothetical protein